MTNANMKLVTVDVPFPGELETYDQKLDAGEFITRRVVELSKLSEEFTSTQGLLFFASSFLIMLCPFVHSQNTKPRYDHTREAFVVRTNS